jgi:hypothetical protein
MVYTIRYLHFGVYCPLFTVVLFTVTAFFKNIFDSGYLNSKLVFV